MSPPPGHEQFQIELDSAQNLKPWCCGHGYEASTAAPVIRMRNGCGGSAPGLDSRCRSRQSSTCRRMRSLKPPVAQLSRKPECTRGRRASQAEPRLGGCDVGHAWPGAGGSGV